MKDFYKEYLFLLLVSSAYGADIEDRALSPTKTGQVGINEPTDVALRGKIGPNTKYLTEKDGLTNWVGVDSDYLTKTVETVTVAGQADATTTKAVNIEITGAHGDDMSILIGPAFRKGLDESYRKAPKCNNERKLRARADQLCGFNAFFENALLLEALPEVDAALTKRNFITDAIQTFFHIPVKSTDVAFVLSGLRAIGVYGIYMISVANVLSIGEAAISYLLMNWRLLHANEGMRLPHIVRVPFSQQGKTQKKEPENKGCVLTEDDPKPIGPSIGCRAPKNGRCTGGEFKGCKCIADPAYIGHPVAEDKWFGFQDKVVFYLPPPLPECSTITEAIRSDYWRLVVNVFCEEFPGDIPKDYSRTISATELHDKSFNTSSIHGFDFVLSFADKPGECSQTCVELYSSISKSHLCNRDSRNMAAKGTIKQSCGDASWTVLSPSSAWRTGDLTPICGTGTGDMYLRSDVLGAVNSFCDNVKEDRLFYKLFQGEANFKTITYLSKIRPAPGHGSDRNALRFDVNIFMQGCNDKPGTVDYNKPGAPEKPEMIPRDKCVDTTMKMFDGCPPLEGSLKYAGSDIYYNCLRWTARSVTA